MRLATWNVNSIRARVDRVTDWLERADVDVLAMQETKCSDDQFPTMPFVALGYDVVHCGFNQWNGVAIASRVGLDDVQVGFDGQPTWSDKPDVEAAAEARALGATCNGVRVWSLYVPNGRSVDSPHYIYKLEWLAALRDTAQRLADRRPVGADRAGRRLEHRARPTRTSGASSSTQNSTHVTPPERAAFNAIVDAQFADVVRPFTPGPGCLHLLGLHAAARFRRTGACASTSSSAHRRWPRASRTPRSCARSARARRPATTRRCWSS